MKWTAALRALKSKLATARPERKVKSANLPSDTVITNRYYPRLWIAGAATVLIGGAASLAITNHIHNTKAWLQVYRNGQYVGLVPDNQTEATKLHRIADGFNVPLKMTTVHTQVASNYDWKRVQSLPTPAAVITLDHKPLVYTTSTEEAHHILGDIKHKLSASVKNAANVTSSYVGHVGVAAVSVGVANILQPKDAEELLMHPSEDTIAGRSSSPMVHLISQGKEAAQLNQPLLKVQSQATVRKTVTLPYHVKYVKDSSMAKGKESIETPGKNGKEQEKVRQTYVNGKATQSHVLAQETVSKPVDEVIKLGTNSGIADGSWIWPTASHVITSPFGYRSFRGGEFHPGVDIGVPVGTPIEATNNGTVISAGWNSGGYGNWVEIDNGHGITTVFGHMSKVAVHSGEVVSQGQVIGYSGESGNATGPHLHYEVRLNGTPVNPMKYT